MPTGWRDDSSRCRCERELLGNGRPPREAAPRRWHLERRGTHVLHRQGTKDENSKIQVALNCKKLLWFLSPFEAGDGEFCSQCGKRWDVMRSVHEAVGEKGTAGQGGQPSHGPPRNRQPPCLSTAVLMY